MTGDPYLDAVVAGLLAAMGTVAVVVVAATWAASIVAPSRSADPE